MDRADYHLFKNSIKPAWEDENNKDVGKWMIRLKKGLASLYWEELIFAMVGEQFDVGNEICGAVISMREKEDVISVWNNTADNIEATGRIK
jgi:translation initiation factor 4E